MSIVGNTYFEMGNMGKIDKYFYKNILENDAFYLLGVFEE